MVLALASAALLSLFFLPLWHIALEAPQYPEGLGMHIWVNTVSGANPNDLQSINELNHYVGMKAITPAAIPELRWMPWVVVGLALLGLLAAAVGRRGLVLTWLGAAGVAALAGLGDFWRWEYDYGHNLNPQAAIKIPGVTLQPPLIGSKQMLNITSHSWPAAGGWITILAVAVVLAVLVSEWTKSGALQGARRG
jgi:hypothetical protein